MAMDAAKSVVDNESDSGQSADLAPLLAAASSGDEAAWRSVIDLYARRVFALCKSRCGRADLAEEITQSVFATVAAKLTSGAYDEQGKFESWLFRVAMNRVRDEMRRIKRHADPTDPAAFGGVGARSDTESDGAMLGAERLDALRSAMSGLSDADREVVELRHHAGLSFKQIAELLSEPMGTLLARHHRALKKLRVALATSGAFPEGATE